MRVEECVLTVNLCEAFCCSAYKQLNGFESDTSKHQTSMVLCSTLFLFSRPIWLDQSSIAIRIY